jgi:type IV secretion system protein VirB10
MPEIDPKIVPQIKDMRAKIAGLLPKDAQARVLGGIALVMVLVIMFSGRKSAPARPAPAARPDTAAVDPNQARIQKYRTRLAEQAEKLAAEEAQLANTKQALGVTPGGTGAGMPARPTGSSLMIPERAAPERTWIEIDREKREYQGLFASNIALSHRASVPTSGAGSTGEHPAGASKDDSRSATAEDRRGSREYRLLEGTLLETVLTNRLDSSFSGPINCMVTTNVYSHDRQALLIPQGTRVLGEVKKLESFGQQRVAVFFHRLIMPDGYSVSLDEFQGLNQIGETGLRDQVNHHYVQVFGVSLAIGAIAGLAQANARYGVNESAADAYEQGVASSMSQSAMRILDRYLNVLPTFTIREGHRIKVYLSQDLKVPAYDQHPAPDGL